MDLTPEQEIEAQRLFDVLRAKIESALAGR